MDTTNIVSTPNITGNIGSCTTNIRTVTAQRNGVWTLDKIDIATNSCTGEVERFYYWEYSFDLVWVFVLTAFSMIAIAWLIGMIFHFKD